MGPYELHIDRDARWKRIVAEFVEKVPLWLALLLSLLGVLLVTVSDVWLSRVFNYDFSLTAFYCLPVGATAWILGMRGGLLISGFATAGDFTASCLGAAHRHSYGVVLLDTLFAVGAYIGTSYFLAEMRWHLDRERRFSRLDQVTGVCNLRSFLEEARVEVVRMGRYGHALSVAYLDIDDFKLVNDNWGHQSGDRVLKVVAQRARAELRSVDVVARIGGDEFAILLPETSHERARRVIHRLRQEVSKACRNLPGGPVTFSIGVKTFVKAPEDLEELLHTADTLMYSVKRNGKDATLFA
jgi:diguanylate cyclase (GGDEF)-like protein